MNFFLRKLDKMNELNKFEILRNQLNESNVRVRGVK